MDKAKLLKELEDIGRGCLIDSESYKFSVKFINWLPDNLMEPEICEERDNISFDWMIDKDHVFSVTIGGKEFFYAWIWDREKGYGTSNFDNMEVFLEFLNFFGKDG